MAGRRQGGEIGEVHHFAQAGVQQRAAQTTARAKSRGIQHSCWDSPKVVGIQPSTWARAKGIRSHRSHPPSPGRRWANRAWPYAHGGVLPAPLAPMNPTTCLFRAEGHAANRLHAPKERCRFSTSMMGSRHGESAMGDGSHGWMDGWSYGHDGFFDYLPADFYWTTGPRTRW